MRFDIRQLEYFAAVAEDLNFTRAAGRLNVAQQSLSCAIARLESDIGFRLFERSSRSVTLTERGSQWLPHVREVLAAAELRDARKADALPVSAWDHLDGRAIARKGRNDRVGSAGERAS